MESGSTFELILFGMIAAFLVLRLWSVLGRRTGFERQGAPRPRAVGPVPAAAVEQAASPPVEPSDRALPDPASPPGQALARMQRVDRDFSPARFLDGAEAAFRMILEAFGAGDRVTLRPLLGDDTYRAFEGAIAGREERGETQRTELRAMRGATIEQAGLVGSIAEVTVRFVSDQVSEVVNGAGTHVSGSEAATETVDTWTFQRDLSQPDPAWRLVRTA